MNSDEMAAPNDDDGRERVEEETGLRRQIQHLSLTHSLMCAWVKQRRHLESYLFCKTNIKMSFKQNMMFSQS